MRMIDRSSAFKRDYKREARGPRRATLDEAFMPVLAALATDQPLDARYRDNDLSGDWAGYRECHVKPDLLLIYRSQASTPFGWRGLDHTVNFLADGDTNGSGGCESPNTLIYWFLKECTL